MNSSSIEQRLSRITTNWDDLIAAHKSDSFDPAAAEQRGIILKRYAECIYQYILGATHCHHTTEDLSQDFALRFVRGDFRNANPDRGRFRDYLKRSLRNLVTDFFRRKNSKPAGVDLKGAEANAIGSLDTAFTDQWRRQLLGITWESLKEHESNSGSLYYSVLYLRSQRPKLNSQSLAKEFTEQYQREVTADWFRQTLRRARRKFADLLVQEVGKTIQSDSKQELADELAILGLQKYVEESEPRARDQS
ncbi:RNA polymerase sigma factor [Mariniblastus fucicola]|uniref:RNA polymerase sigma factor n=1 Tax=Mariniblastus fucicola TaxID=980251 RepID=UPI0012F7D204|nr:sigma factor [Mariniblastus fucicola]